MLLIEKSALQRMRGKGLGASSAAPSNPAEAAICPQGITAGNCGCTVDTQNVQSLFDSAVSTRLLPWPLPDPSWANCSNSHAQGVVQAAGITKAATGLATTGIGAGATIAGAAAAGSVVPIVGTIIGAIGGIIASIFGHHAQAVEAQNAALCGAIPAVNQALQAIDAGLANGSITPAQAQSSYSALQAQFSAAMKAGTSYKKCDALYACDLAMQMLVWQRNQDLQNGVLTSGQPAPWATSSSGGAAGVSIPGVPSDLLPWLVIGGAVAAAFLL